MMLLPEQQRPNERAQEEEGEDEEEDEVAEPLVGLRGRGEEAELVQLALRVMSGGRGC